MTTLTSPGKPHETGEMVHASHVLAVNVVKDLREMMTNLIGGSMRRYETLLEEAIGEVKRRFCEELRAQGYDGAVGVRIAHPQVVGGGAELIIYGTGFRWTDGADTESA